VRVYPIYTKKATASSSEKLVNMFVNGHSAHISQGSPNYGLPSFFVNNEKIFVLIW